MNRRRFIGRTAIVAAGTCLNPVVRHLDGFDQAEERDATSELQALLDTGGEVALQPGRRYLVNARQPGLAALTIHSDTSLDLRGAVVELGPENRCPVIATDAHSRTRNVRIMGGEIRGNASRKAVQIVPSLGITPTLFLRNCDKLELANLRLRDTSFYSLYAQGDDGRAENIAVDLAIGGGLWIAGTRWKIDSISVRDVRFLDLNSCQGNPFIVKLSDSSVGALHCENYGFGIKFQDGCTNVTVDSITAIGGPNNEPHPNPLVKVQGMNDARGRHFNEHIRIKNLATSGGSVSGLYVIYSDDVQIDQYSGRDNCRLPYYNPAYLADVQLLESSNIRFGLLDGEEVRHCGLWADKKAQNVDIQRLKLSAASKSAKPKVIQSSTIKVHQSALFGFAQ